jgi:NitT/TauT family transport system substrate-binding protein
MTGNRNSSDGKAPVRPSRIGGNMMRFKSRIHRTMTVLGALSAGMALVAACGVVEEGAGGDNNNNNELPVVRFGATQNPSSIGSVAEVIKAKKLDEECGIRMEMLSFSPDAADVALLSGQTDVGYFGYNSWAGSKEKLQKLAMLAPLQAEHGTLFVPEDSSVRKLEDLKGKKIAILPPVSGQYQDFAMLVGKMGLNLKRDFNPVTGPPPAIEAFLKRGEVDAAILFEPNATNLLAAGEYRPILKLNDQWQEVTGDPLYMLGVSANSAWLDGHEKEAKCAVSAVREATEMLANDTSVYQELKDELKAKNDEHLSDLADNLGAIYTSESADEAEGSIRRQLEVAKDLDLIPDVPDTIFTRLES